MKKTLSFILVIATLLASIAALSSCAKDSDAPEGMQLVRGGEDIGYYMYAPEEWIVANQSELGIAAAYVSKLNNTSVTLVEASFTETGLASTYIADELAKFPESFDVKITAEPKDAKLGNSTAAKKISYTYKYGEYTYQTLQIFALYGSRAYIFTYTASTELYDGEITYYEEFLEKVNSVITNIKFVDIQGGDENNTELQWSEGYALVSDSKLCGFDLYMPESYTLDFATSIVSISKADGTNINVSEATDTNTDSIGYWTSRFEHLKRIATDVKLINTEATNIKDAQVPVELGDKLRATSLYYSFTLSGKTWCVYQVLIVDGMDGYVFTYTAEEAVFGPNLAEAQTILNKIEF